MARLACALSSLVPSRAAKPNTSDLCRHAPQTVVRCALDALAALAADYAKNCASSLQNHRGDAYAEVPSAALSCMPIRYTLSLQGTGMLRYIKTGQIV